MSESNHSRLKAILEYGPLVAFVLGYYLLKDDKFIVAGTEYSGFVAVTALFVPIAVICALIQWRVTGQMSVMQVVTIALVLVMGGLTVWMNDERFLKSKPTIIYLFFAALLAIGLWRGQSWLKLALGSSLPLTDQGWMMLTRRFVLFFLGLAAANEVVWRNFSTETWIWFKFPGLLIIMFAFLMTQAKLFETHAEKGETPEK